MKEITAEIVTTDLAAARAAAGVTQHDLAAAVEGLSRSYVAMIEAGERPFPRAHVEPVVAVIQRARAKREADREKMRAIIDDVIEWTEEDRRRLEAERRLAEYRLVHRNDFGG